MSETPSNPLPADQPAPAPKKKPMPRWARIVVILAGIIVMISGIAQFFGGGHDVPYGKDNITYYHDASRADADALAKALQDASYFGKNADGVTVLLDKKGDAVTLSFVVNPDKAKDLDTKKLFHDVFFTGLPAMTNNVRRRKSVHINLFRTTNIPLRSSGFDRECARFGGPILFRWIPERKRIMRQNHRHPLGLSRIKLNLRKSFKFAQRPLDRTIRLAHINLDNLSPGARAGVGHVK